MELSAPEKFKKITTSTVSEPKHYFKNHVPSFQNVGNVKKENRFLVHPL